MIIQNDQQNATKTIHVVDNVEYAKKRVKAVFDQYRLLVSSSQKSPSALVSFERLSSIYNTILSITFLGNRQIPYTEKTVLDCISKIAAFIPECNHNTSNALRRFIVALMDFTAISRNSPAINNPFQLHQQDLYMYSKLAIELASEAQMSDDANYEVQNDNMAHKNLITHHNKEQSVAYVGQTATNPVQQGIAETYPPFFIQADDPVWAIGDKAYGQLVVDNNSHQNPLQALIHDLVSRYLQITLIPLSSTAIKEVKIPREIHEKLNTLTRLLLFCSFNHTDKILTEIVGWLQDEFVGQQARIALIQAITNTYFNNKFIFTDFIIENTFSKILTYFVYLLGRHSPSAPLTDNPTLYFTDEAYYFYIKQKPFATIEWELLFEALTLNPISSIAFSILNISKLSDDLWEKFITLLASKHELTLTITANELMALSKNRRQALAKLSQDNGLRIEVNLGDSKQYLNSQGKIQEELIVALKQISVLCLKKTLYTNSRQQEKALQELRFFSEVIEKVKACEINFGNSDFDQLTVDSLQLLAKLFAALNVQKYELKNISLYKMSQDQIASFFSAINNKDLTSLDISDNTIMRLDYATLNAMLNQLKNFPIKNLKLNNFVNHYRLKAVAS